MTLALDNLFFKGKLSVDDAGTGAAPGGAVTEITGIISMTPFGEKQTQHQFKYLNQADAYLRNKGGTIPSPELEVKCRYNSATYIRLRAMLGIDDHSWTITYHDDGAATPLTYVVAGRLFEVTPDVMDDPDKGSSISFKVIQNGVPVVTAAA